MPEIKLDRSISYLEGTQRVYDEATTLENTKDEVKKDRGYPTCRYYKP
nr:hypothetical protein [Methanosarcina barkeri]